MMDIKEFINIFNDSELSDKEIIIKSNIAKAVDFVKQNYGFNLLKEIIAVDNQEDGIKLSYHLYSIENEEDLILSTVVNNEAESISKIFDSAIADENEIYDLFGVKFIGNEFLKRLYMPEAWEGHPLKKDYDDKDERLGWND